VAPVWFRYWGHWGHCLSIAGADLYLTSLRIVHPPLEVRVSRVPDSFTPRSWLESVKLSVGCHVSLPPSRSGVVIRYSSLNLPNIGIVRWGIAFRYPLRCLIQRQQVDSGIPLPGQPLRGGQQLRRSTVRQWVRFSASALLVDSR